MSKVLAEDRHELRPLSPGTDDEDSEVILQVLAKITRWQAAPRSTGSPTERRESLLTPDAEERLLLG